MDRAEQVRRVLADPALVAAFARVYSGPHDPRDALGWVLAPLEVGPTGAVPPAAPLGALRATLYRPSPPPDAAARVAALESALAEERRRIDEALDTVLTAASARTSAPTAAPDRGSGEQPSGAVARRPCRPRPIVIAAATVATVIALALLVPALAGRSPGGREPTLATAARAKADYAGRLLSPSDRISVAQYFRRYPSDLPSELAGLRPVVDVRASGGRTFALDTGDARRLAVYLCSPGNGVTSEPVSTVVLDARGARVHGRSVQSCSLSLPDLVTTAPEHAPAVLVVRAEPSVRWSLSVYAG